jgi:hypothetical protein
MAVQDAAAVQDVIITGTTWAMDKSMRVLCHDLLSKKHRWCAEHTLKWPQ